SFLLACPTAGGVGSHPGFELRAGTLFRHELALTGVVLAVYQPAEVALGRPTLSSPCLTENATSANFRTFRRTDLEEKDDRSADEAGPEVNCRLQHGRCWERLSEEGRGDRMVVTVRAIVACRQCLRNCDETVRASVHLKSQFILNGVCVIWRGWVDLVRLDGIGCLEFDDERAEAEDALLREQIEQYNRRLRDFEERQRQYRQEQERQAESEAEVVQALLQISNPPDPHPSHPNSSG
ncbi:hypothetical protein BaRGS_00008459, partial [Batillaria attramentaria]